MKYFTRRTMLIAVFILLIAFAVIAYNMLVGKNIMEMSINPQSGNVAVPTYSDLYSHVKILDHNLDHLQTLNLIGTNWIPFNCKYSRDGSKLYVCLADMSRTGLEHDYQEFAKLAVFETSTWQVNYYDIPLWAMQMYVPLEDDIVYIACGFDNDPKLLKINTNNGQILNSVDYNGKPECNGLTMNYDESKIYIHSRKMRDMEWGCEWKSLSEVIIYDTDLSLIDKIQIAPDLIDMINGPDNKIYIAHANNDAYVPYNECASSEVCVSVLDTALDEIVYEFLVTDTRAASLALDYNRNCLYISPLTPQETNDEELYFNIDLLPINSVIKVDLSDWSYTWINVADETIGPIALSPDGTRLYAAAVNTDSQKVYYVDLE